MAINMTDVIPSSFTAKVRGVDFPIANIEQLPVASLRKIFEYGLQRISNDSAASAKTDEEAVNLAKKRWANLESGIIRASGSRIGDPVKRRAMELAMNAVAGSVKFKAWYTEAKLKASDKAVVAKQREQAEKHISNYMAQAKIDVEAQQALPELELTDL